MLRFTTQSVRSMSVRATGQGMRSFSSQIKAPPMVYISGEEMTEYTMSIIMKEWVEPHIDTSRWEFYDLSCRSRDNTEDKVLHDAVDAGQRIKAIFKEPTVTPTEVQKAKLGLKKSWGSPNGAMRRGWNGITISRDTIHIDGIELGFKKPVLFERHAVGGEYGAGFKQVGAGRLMTTFFPDDDSTPIIVDARHVTDEKNAAVVYHNPYDNVADLAHIFFQRCLAADIVPYVVTKKTVFKWQEPFWTTMKEIFDEDYKTKFLDAGLLEKTGGELAHLISDAATMQIIRWTDGGFGMACHNYDGDMLTDEVAQVHRSPGFITSNLVGRAPDGTLIREFEASHGTVTDLYDMMQRGEETSLNPLGMAEALMGAINHSAIVAAATQPGEQANKHQLLDYTKALRKALHNTFRYGQGTKDLSGPQGLSTEAFVSKVGERLGRYLQYLENGQPIPEREILIPDFEQTDIDTMAVKAMFDGYDLDGSGTIDLPEFLRMVTKLGVAPRVSAEAESKADKRDEVQK